MSEIEVFKSAVVKRSIVIAGHKTSISMESEFWTGLKELAKQRNSTLSRLVSDIEGGCTQTNLSSEVRLAVLRYYRDGKPV